jgi:hypothetical protein
VTVTASAPARRRRRRAVVALAAAGLGALVVLGACGDTGPTSLDMVQATSSIKSYVDLNYGNFTHGAPACPATEPIAKGTTFTCTVTVGSGTLHISVTENTDDGTQISFVPVEAVLDRSVVAGDLPAQVADQFTGDVVVNCGYDPVAVVAVGQGFDCTGLDAVGVSRPIHVTVTDVAGHYTVTVT